VDTYREENGIYTTPELSEVISDKPSYCWEWTDRVVWPCTVCMQHAADCYFRRGNFLQFTCSQYGFNLFTR